MTLPDLSTEQRLKHLALIQCDRVPRVESPWKLLGAMVVCSGLWALIFWAGGAFE